VLADVLVMAITEIVGTVAALVVALSAAITAYRARTTRPGS
jgi:hypothetical protein